MQEIFLLDAVHCIFRSYYAITPMVNQKGLSTHALYGFIRSLQKALSDFRPLYFVAVFDGEDNSRQRHAIYSEYKAHRKAAPPDLYPQILSAIEFCRLAGIPYLAVEGVEADDTMATVAVWAKSQGSKVTICSSDKDLMQLVDDRVQMIDLQKGNVRIDAAKVKEQYGVSPKQMLDLLAMMGDSSDNIPGLPGFGAKTAAALLQEFGSLDAILAHPEKVKGEKKQQVLREQKELAFLSRKLATLDTQVPIPNNAEFYRLGEGDRQGLVEFYEEMNFQSLLEGLGSAKIETNAQETTTYQLVDNEEEAEKLFLYLKKAPEFCVDTETTGGHFMLAELVGVSFCVVPKEAFYLPLNGELGKEKASRYLRSFFQEYQGNVYGHNIKYDWHIFQNEGIDLPLISFDTLLASYLLHAGKRQHGLDALAFEKFHKVKIDITSLIGKGKNQKTMLEVPIDQVRECACEDADYTARLKILFQEELAARSLTSLLRDVELPLLPILGAMERRGVFVDPEPLAEVGKKIQVELQKLSQMIWNHAGEEFNLNSPKQLSHILFEKLLLSPPGKKKSETSTSADVLEELAKEHPIAREILEYRMLEKLRSTYVEALPQAILPTTGRIHCTFNQSVTATGRLSCQDPNLQNIPVRSVDGRLIRACFRPQQKHWKFLSADYSQIELRLLAHYSEDPDLIETFQKGEDIHARTASRLFEVPLEEVTSEMRAQAKAVNFGVLYGQGPFALSQQTGMTFREASHFIKAYFARYPQILNYLDSSKEQVRATGVAMTLWGRQRAIPEMNNRNQAIRAAAERLAVNTPLQGTAADLIKVAMIAIEKEIKKRNLQSMLLLQIHDELLFEIPDAESEEMVQLVKERMEKVAFLRVPIEVSIAIGKNWGEC